VAQSIHQLTQMAARTGERLDGQDLMLREADERLEALINAQLRYEARQERLRGTFPKGRESHQMLVGLPPFTKRDLTGRMRRVSTRIHASMRSLTRRYCLRSAWTR